jgi:antibiotic biosynthesis monooxygenase (ABM) superfamily enzyme
MKYKSPEADIRNAIIDKFRCSGIVVKRIENSICGRHKSIPDLWFFDPVTKIAGWMEVKSKTGTLTKGEDSQEEFQTLCKVCGVNHWVVRSVDEAMAATGRLKHDTNRLAEIEGPE